MGGETIFYPELGPAKKYSGRSAEGTRPISVGLEVGMVSKGLGIHSLSQKP